MSSVWGADPEWAGQVCGSEASTDRTQKEGFMVMSSTDVSCVVIVIILILEDQTHVSFTPEGS